MHNFEQAQGVMAGICIECWLDLRCVVQQTLLRVPESTTFRELFRKKVASKVVSRDCHEELLAVSVSPMGKGEWKTVRCEEKISLIVSFGCRYIKFQLSQLAEEPPAKHVCPNRHCAFGTLLQNAAKHDCLPSARQVVTCRGTLYYDVIAHLEVFCILRIVDAYLFF